MAKAPKVVQSSFTMVHSDTPGLGAVIERAMIQATEDAMAEGITEPSEILARKLAAKEEAEAAFYARQQAALDEHHATVAAQVQDAPAAPEAAPETDEG